MRPSSDYLAIPFGYFGWLGGLRWSEDGEAVEYVERLVDQERSFALAGEIALFLEGFQVTDRPLCFSHVLHLLHLLGVGRRSVRAETFQPGRQPSELAYVFHELGRPLRNAGALCASLCREIPGTSQPPDLGEVRRRLTRRPTDIHLRRTFRLPDPAAEVPPLEPLIFEARVLRPLASDYSTEELRHWLKTGRAWVGDVAEPLAQAADGLRPRTLAVALALLERRQRLVDAAPLVATLTGALALPPRRLAPAELPTGGYADVANRGQPEQLLPVQFALDPNDFLRRFAERELLYFHREEPNEPTSETLIVVVDQGVRTWGDVRLILGAATLAIGRQAARRGLVFQIATTADPLRLIDPLSVNSETLGQIIEASDLSPDPSLVLSQVLQRECAGCRDIVLLTHPRNLAAPSVLAVARTIPSGTRLFSVSVDERGAVGLAELRRGAPIPLASCRVAIRHRSVPATTSLARSVPPVWSGDAEPIGYPFRLGVINPIRDHFDFDESGEWLFTLGSQGLVHAWRVDGTAAETLPRAQLMGQPITALDTLVGVGGGVVVAGVTPQGRVLVHYDLVARRCQVYVLGPMGPIPTPTLRYLQPLHTVVQLESQGSTSLVAVDLAAPAAGAIYPPRQRQLPFSVRAQYAYNSHSAWGREPSEGHPAGFFEPMNTNISIDHGSFLSWNSERVASRELSIELEPGTGVFRVRTEQAQWPPFLPLGDGQPILKNCVLTGEAAGGDVVAVSCAPNPSSSPSPLLTVHLFAGPIGRVICSYTTVARSRGFALSRDGLLFARKLNERQVEVRAVGGRFRRLVTSKGKIHTQLDVTLGDEFLVARAGEHFHLVRWDRGPLERVQGQGDPWSLLQTSFPAELRQTTRLSASPREERPRALRDTMRFPAWCRRRVVLALDMLSQLVILDREGSLVAQIWVFRDQFAAWAPDGTRIGPARLLGGEPTPGGAEQLGFALRQASDRGRD